MKSLFLVVFLGLWLPGAPVWAYSYGPACQWIHLEGKVERPAELQEKEPIFFTVTYQIEGMKHPATLLTNYPLSADKFRFFFAGFNEELPNAILVPPMFFFAKEITFRYFVKTRDGSWRSDFYQSVFQVPRIPRVTIPAHSKEDYRCHSGLELPVMSLNRGSD